METDAQSRENYHHGNLPETLIQEGAQLLAERGIERFSMREVARRAGVAAAAPSHHFGNAKGLLTAIATDGFQRLAARQEAAQAASTDREEQIVAMCRAYIETCAEAPGHAAIMFRVDLLDEGDERFRERSFYTFDLLSTALRAAAPTDVQADQISYATKTLWAAMHGLQALEMIEADEADALIRFAVRTLIAGLQ